MKTDGAHRALREDQRSISRFPSLWQVVVHATDPKEDRLKLYKEAHMAMAEFHRWRDYEMSFSPSGRHVGYVYRDPKHWFYAGMEQDSLVIHGPFKMKRTILRLLGVTSAKRVATGHYRVEAGHDYLARIDIFTRAMAEKAIGRRLT